MLVMSIIFVEIVVFKCRFLRCASVEMTILWAGAKWSLLDLEESGSRLRANIPLITKKL